VLSICCRLIIIILNPNPKVCPHTCLITIKALGTTKQLSTAYHPQTDGQTERINQEIGMFLKHYINYQQNNWTEWLAAAEFQYNNKRHAATERTLFELNFGRHL